MKPSSAWLGCALALAACSREPTPQGGESPRAETNSSASSTPPAPSARPAPHPAPSPPPTLALTRRYETELSESAAIYQGENTVFIGMGARLGRLSEAGFEWLRWIPKDTGFGPNEITGAGGRFPDLYYVTYQSLIARAPTPAFLPLPKGAPSVFSPGGGAGFVNGVARVGDTLLVAGYSNTQGRVLVSAAGKQLVRKQKLPQDAGCKGDELTPESAGAGRHAIETSALGSTPRGTLVSLGVLCNRRNPTLEVWLPDQTESKLIDIPWRGDTIYTQAFSGSGDSLWLVDTQDDRILRYDAGKVTEVPAPTDIHAAFSQAGTLYLLTRDTIYQLPSSADARPAPIAKLRWPFAVGGFARVGSTFWVTREGRLYELTPTEPTDPSASCKTHFVYLYAVTRDAPKTYSFPKTRGVLRKFEAAGRLRLLEFEAAGRNVGVAVPDQATAKKLLAHLRKSMPKERPELLCFAPSNPREVDLKTGRSLSAR